MSPRDLFPGLEPTRAPADLRDRVLETAIRAAAEPGSGLIDRLWSSTPLRLAWAGGVLVLLVANLVATGDGPATLSQIAASPSLAAELPPEVRDLWPSSRRARAVGPTAGDRRLLEQVLASGAWDLS